MSDPCECLYSHEALMRRLLSALRDSQNDCTDTECAGPSGDGGAAGGMNFTLMLAMWGVAAFLLFLTRPQSLRSRGDPHSTEKPSLDRDDSHHQPPPSTM